MTSDRQRWDQVLQGLEPEIAKYRDQAEQDREIPAELVRRLAEAGLFRLMVPREHGGFEAAPETVLHAVRAVARTDASVAWLLMASVNSALLAGRMNPEGAGEVFADPLSVVAGSLHKGGTARRTPDGFVVSGRWRLASGCAAADWLICGASRYGDDQTARPAIFLVERSAATVVKTWDAIGLRGSGTDDFVLDEVAVPVRRFIAPDAPVRIDRPLYRSAMANFINPPLAAVGLGIADDAIMSFAEVARNKRPRGSTEPISRLATVQDTYARACALRDAAAEYLFSAVRRAWLVAEREPTLPHQATADVMLATSTAMLQCVEAVTRLYTAAGATSIFESSRLARCFRDVHVANHHDAASEAVFARVGDFLLNGRD